MTTKKTTSKTTATKAAGKKTATPKADVETKPAKEKKTKVDKPKKLSALDAAAKVLGESAEPMSTKAMIEAMSTKGYWTSPGGQTPSATLYTVVTMLPCLAPWGAGFKRARGDPIGDSNMPVFNLDDFHQGPNDFLTSGKVGGFQTLANMISEVFQLAKNQT